MNEARHSQLLAVADRADRAGRADHRRPAVMTHGRGVRAGSGPGREPGAFAPGGDRDAAARLLERSAGT